MSFLYRRTTHMLSGIADCHIGGCCMRKTELRIFTDRAERRKRDETIRTQSSQARYNSFGLYIFARYNVST